MRQVIDEFETKNDDHRSRRPWLEICILTAVLACMASVMLRLQASPPPEVVMAGFATSLQERTPSRFRHRWKDSSAGGGVQLQQDGQVVVDGSRLRKSAGKLRWRPYPRVR